MVKINLLRRSRAEKSQRHRQARFEALVLIGVLALMVVGGGVTWWNLSQTRDYYQMVKDRKVHQLSQQQRRSQQAEGLNQQVAALEDRITRVSRLVEQRRRAIQLLDVVSRSLDPLALWLENLQMNHDTVLVEGLAVSKRPIVEFANTLKAHSLFQDVAILETGQSAEEVALVEFSIMLHFAEGGDHVISS